MQPDPFLHQQIDSYRVQYRMPDGGMSLVYKAYDTHRQQDVVLKILHDKYINHREVADRFRREIDIAKNLHHTHIVPFYGFGTVAGRPYIALRYMPGGSLNDVIKRGAPIPLGDVARWLTQVASALDYAHSRGVIHRDIKPGNVLLDEKNDASLSDFGIARLVEAPQLTRTDMAMPGTARFMSPEQAVGADSIDGRSDVYSLAVLAYMLTVGDYPFDGPNEVSIIIQHIDQPPPKPSAMNPDLPRALDKVILRGMAKRPRQRHQTASAFATDFAQAVDRFSDITTVPDPADMPLEQPTGEFMTMLPQRVHRAPPLWLRLTRLALFALLGTTLIVGLAAGAAFLPDLLNDSAPTASPRPPVEIINETPAPQPSPLPSGPASVTPAPPTPLAASPTPVEALSVPNNWLAGTELVIQQATGISISAGLPPVDESQFQPGDVVTITPGLVEGGGRREWYGGPDPARRWWHVAVPGGGTGWLPESALGETIPDITAAPPTMTPDIAPQSTATPAG